MLPPMELNMTWKRRVWIGISLISVGGVAIALLGWSLMTRPFYQPGRLEEVNILPFHAISGAYPDRPWQTEDGVRLHHFSTGQGRPVIILHGGPGQPFRSPIEALAPLEDSYRFIYYDQRGCGASGRPVDRPQGANPYAKMKDLVGKLGLAIQLSDLERVRRAVVAHPDEPVILLGHSYGAFLAALFAAEFPHRVNGLILVASADLLVLPGSGPDLFTLVSDHLPAGNRAAYQQFIAGYLDFPRLLDRSDDEMRALNHTFAEFYLTAVGQATSAVPADIAATGGWMVQAQYLSMGQRHDYRAAMARIQAPVLILHGDRDLVSVTTSETYLRAIPGARLKLVEGAGHQIFADRPESFQRAVAGFLREFP